MTSSAHRPRPVPVSLGRPPAPSLEDQPAVHVDCEGCTARPSACGDCVVTYLLGSPPEGVDLDVQEQEALEVLAASGLVPALQYRPEEPRLRPVQPH